MIVKTHHKCAIDLSYTIIDHSRLLVSNFANFHFVLVSQECTTYFLTLLRCSPKIVIADKQQCKTWQVRNVKDVSHLHFS